MANILNFHVSVGTPRGNIVADINFKRQNGGDDFALPLSDADARCRASFTYTLQTLLHPSEKPLTARL